MKEKEGLNHGIPLPRVRNQPVDERESQKLANEPTHLQMEVTLQEVGLELLEEEEEEGEMSQVIQEGMMGQMGMEMRTLKRRMTLALLQQG